MLALMGELIGESGIDVEGKMGGAEMVNEGQGADGGASWAVSLSPLQRIIADNILAVEGAKAAAGYVFMLGEVGDGNECGRSDER